LVLALALACSTAMMRDIQRALDPMNIMNPGKVPRDA
jgi:FAD/FMN-containing dehydrogenase